MAGKPRKTTETNNFYRDLGRAIRLARMGAGKTQADVADQLGVSFQQHQKYENGTNRIPVEQLLALADYLDVSVSRLLNVSGRDAELLSLSENFDVDDFHALLESWAQIRNKGMRAALLNVLKRTAELGR